MLIDRVVINASPLIILFKSQQADLLPALFNEILIPGAVWNEVIAAGKTDAAAQQLPNATWARRIELKRSPLKF